MNTTMSHSASSDRAGCSETRRETTPVSRATTTGAETAHSNRRKAGGSFLGRFDSRGSPGTEAADVEMETLLGSTAGIYATPQARVNRPYRMIRSPEREGTPIR